MRDYIHNDHALNSVAGHHNLVSVCLKIVRYAVSAVDTNIQMVLWALLENVAARSSEILFDRITTRSLLEVCLWALEDMSKTLGCANGVIIATSQIEFILSALTCRLPLTTRETIEQKILELYAVDVRNRGVVVSAQFILQSIITSQGITETCIASACATMAVTNLADRSVISCSRQISEAESVVDFIMAHEDDSFFFFDPSIDIIAGKMVDMIHLIQARYPRCHQLDDDKFNGKEVSRHTSRYMG
jgi:hypothetical protein